MGKTYEWDQAKAESNFKKHNIRFTDAMTIFLDDFALTIEDGHINEERFVSIGLDDTARLLTVVFTWRLNTIRIISARKATKSETNFYENEL